MYTVNAEPVILIVLGCANRGIQQERVDAALEYINKSTNPIILYVSGGVKNSIQNTAQVTEASSMASEFDDNSNIQIILDEKSTNTAENFAYLKQWINQNLSEKTQLPEFVITTSDYHKTRAEKIFNGILPEVSPTWNLSKSDCDNCWTDEHIHMKNIKVDVYNAIRIIL
jgi:hypothetical protein